MNQSKQLQSGDLVYSLNEQNSKEKRYGIVFFIKEDRFLLLSDGTILYELPLDKSITFICHTVLVVYEFKSLKQVRQDFVEGNYDSVIKPIYNSF